MATPQQQSRLPPLAPSPDPLASLTRGSSPQSRQRQRTRDSFTASTASSLIRRSLSPTRLSASRRERLPFRNVDSPGPARYSPDQTISRPTIRSSGFGSAARFVNPSLPYVPSASTQFDALGYTDLQRARSPSPVIRPRLSETGARYFDQQRPTDSPGPKYMPRNVAPASPEHRFGGAPRFPSVASDAPGPVYSPVPQPPRSPPRFSFGKEARVMPTPPVFSANATMAQQSSYAVTKPKAPAAAGTTEPRFGREPPSRSPGPQYYPDDHLAHQRAPSPPML
ncbi:hypothetical protein PAPYR_1166 [Paratrimastix pyriformis]|uniref:Uncharacterized protein n=1 Tax=Paratrimastix pyriformis TaxID=342808 RepID=A0ABQ8US95_9EUKA|nr:hypothetical protein PAPYR_1166 [Paratrimastix pyriformis]